MNLEDALRSLISRILWIVPKGHSMKSKKVIPEGSQFTEWFLVLSKKEKPRIRREIRTPDGERMQVSHPQKHFKHLLNDMKELEDFVIRLNGRDPKIERIKERLTFQHAYIGKEFLDEYRETYLRNYIPSEVEAKKLTFYLQTYALNYFIGRLNLPNPLDWKRNEASWGLALTLKQGPKDQKVFDDGLHRSSKVLKMIVYELNRFMRFLHTKHPDVPALTFEPLSRAVVKDYEARREMRGEVDESKYIPIEHWKAIEKALPDSWGPLIKLCYYYGLRRKEAYGLKSGDIKKGYLSIERQLDVIELDQRRFKPSKNRTTRKCPHWLIKPNATLALVKGIEELTLHPDSISHLFSKLCSDLKIPKYTIHDLRRSFITNCIQKGVVQEDLRLAVGHENGATTYQYYVMDSRKLDDETFDPTA